MRHCPDAAASSGAILLVGSIVVYGAMGALIYLRNIPAVIVTMGMSFVWTGIGYSLQDTPGGQAPDWLVKMFSLKFPVPESVIVALLLGLVAFFIYRSRYGTILKGFGNNPAVVQRSGWSPLKAIVVGYVVAGIFAVIGGMNITATTGASDVNSTKSYTLLTVAAVVMGGSELLGGSSRRGERYWGHHTLPGRRSYRFPSSQFELCHSGARVDPDRDLASRLLRKVRL